MSPKRILTRHPQGKNGKSIDREKYDAIRTAILRALGREEVTHSELMRRIAASLEHRFDGNTHWYGETVKLDLEARRVIERTDGKPQRYRVRRRAGVSGHRPSGLAAPRPAPGARARGARPGNARTGPVGQGRPRR